MISPQRFVEALRSARISRAVPPFEQPYSNNGAENPFNSLSMFIPSENECTDFWWRITGSMFSQMLKRAFYPVERQYHYLIFYYLVVLPELGPAPPATVSSNDFTDEPTISEFTDPCLPTVASLTSDKSSSASPTSAGLPFQSYMTDDHSPLEISWRSDSEGGKVVRFAIDPVRRQLEDDHRGAIGIFEDLGRSNFLPPGVDLDWCRICANFLTLSAGPLLDHGGGATPEYPSQYFVGFDLLSLGIVMKAYFLPETRAAITSTTNSTLISSCIAKLSKPTPTCPNPPDLLTPWNRVLSFTTSLAQDLAPSFPVVAVDCVPSWKNRVKVYVRTPRSTLANLRRFLTLGRDISCTSPATQRALKQITIIWHLLFPALSNDDSDDIEPPCPQHPTGGLLWYYELRPGHAEPFPKIYLPVRHWCSSDEEVVRVMEAFYTKIGNFMAAERYGRDVRETYTHRSLSARTGIHTYIAFAVKENDVEIMSYFNPECYAPERGRLN